MKKPPVNRLKQFEKKAVDESNEMAGLWFTDGMTDEEIANKNIEWQKQQIESLQRENEGLERLLLEKQLKGLRPRITNFESL